MVFHTQYSLFLSQSYQDALNDYQRSLRYPGFNCWDYIVLTASNEQQAAVFRAQLAEREAKGALPMHTRFLVIPDRDGRRVGSGGATLGALKELADISGRQDFSGLKILVIHSGGDSKRVPQYSALGKLFSPVPHELPDGRPSSLFDEFLIVMSLVPSRMREGMLLLSGDVLLLFNPLLIDFSGHGAVAIAFKEKVEVGCHHGVFLQGQDGKVARFLHKQSPERLRTLGAVNEHGDVDIDTGAVIFSTEVMRALYSLVSDGGKFSQSRYEALVNDTVRLSLYADFLYPLAADSTWEEFQKETPEGTFCPELLAARRQVWEVLSPFSMKLQRLAPAKFIHFGTSREIMSLMCRDLEDYEELTWTRQTVSSIVGQTAGYASVLSSRASIGDDCYLEVSYVHRDAKVGNRVLLSFIDIHDETIPDDVVVHGLKLRDGTFTVRIYGIGDNPKATLEQGGTLLGKPLAEFLQAYQLTAADLWGENEEHSLWNAKLYPRSQTVREALAAALNLHALVNGQGNLAAWRQADRKSLLYGFQEADPEALVSWAEKMRELVQMDRLSKCLKEGTPASALKDSFAGRKISPVQKIWLDKHLAQANMGEAARLHFYLGTALGENRGAAEIAECFAVIRQKILQSTLDNLVFNDKCRIVKDCHTVQLPLRVNWGGGWSDTPPYCLEHGGTVLNASILLQGRKPVEVRLEKIPEAKIVFDSRDMDVHGEFSQIEPLQATGDPYDPFALQKAALLACGVLPQTGGNLKSILKRLGGGFVMSSEVTGVPKGSGLGTSSILSACCVKAIFEFLGIPHTDEDLYSHVLCMEQLMSTGGGWQDQVGGIVPGVKYITSSPGINQRLNVQILNLSPETQSELSDRFILIYTGQRRLARNLLRDVVGRYIGNEQQALFALNEIQKRAALMRFELERGQVDAFASLLNEHWELSRQIDAGTTNRLIDQIFATVEDLIDGKMICGAGGGGFLQAILKKGVSKQEIHQRLKSVFGDSDIDLWDCTLLF